MKKCLLILPVLSLLVPHLSHAHSKNCQSEAEEAGRKEISKHCTKFYSCDASYVDTNSKGRPLWFVTCTTKDLGHGEVQVTAAVRFEDEDGCEVRKTEYEGYTKSKPADDFVE